MAIGGVTVRLILVFIVVIGVVPLCFFIATSDGSLARMHVPYLPALFSGVVGGGLVALLTTKGVRNALYGGFFLATFGVGLILYSGFDPHGRSFLLWAWPVFFLPGFLIGAFFANLVSRIVQKTSNGVKNQP